MSAPRDDALPDGDGPALVEAEEATSGADLYAVLGVTPAAAYDRAHGYQFTRPPVPAGGYVRRSSMRGAEHERAASGNPNGAGQLAGILCVILAIALLGRSLTQTSGAAWSSLALFVVSACLFAL